MLFRCKGLSGRSSETTELATGDFRDHNCVRYHTIFTRWRAPKRKRILSSSRVPVFFFACREKDIEKFRKAAESEGFSGLSQWILFHLRKIAEKGKAKDIDNSP